jgi:hypothetical protein
MRDATSWNVTSRNQPTLWVEAEVLQDLVCPTVRAPSHLRADSILRHHAGDILRIRTGHPKRDPTEAVADTDRTARKACWVLLPTPAYPSVLRPPVPSQAPDRVDDGDDRLRRSTGRPRPARQSSRPATSDSPLKFRARDARDVSRDRPLFRSDFQRCLFLQAPTVASFNLSCRCLVCQHIQRDADYFGPASGAGAANGCIATRSISETSHIGPGYTGP